MINASLLYAGNGDLIVNGNLGIGTTSPGAQFEQAYGTFGGYVYNRTKYGANTISVLGKNSNNNAYFDLYNSSGTIGVRLSPEPYIASYIVGGKVGIGTTAPESTLHVMQLGPGWYHGLILQEPSVGIKGQILVSTDNNMYFASSQNSNAGWLNYSGQWISSSDSDFKTNNIDLNKYGLETVLRMRPRQYNMKNTEQPQVGFTAQEMKDLVPEVVSGEEISKGGKGMGIAYGHMTPILVKAIQEQQGQIAGQKSALLKFDGFTEAIHVDKATGHVGIGTSYPSATLEVNGTFAATTKNFDIKDPRFNDDKKRLIHSSLEGPEVGVYYRGEAKLEKGLAIVTLPPYFEALTRKENRTVFLTPKFENEDDTLCSVAGSDVRDGKFKIRAFGPPDLSACVHKVFWEVKAERNDVGKLSVEQVR